jgi:zinc transport system permease protein
MKGRLETSVLMKAVVNRETGIRSSDVLSLVAVMESPYYHKLFAVTFDEGFAKASGTRVSLYNTVIAILTAVTVVLGMRMMGTLLISALVIFPALTAMRVCKSFRGVVLTAAAVSLCCFFVGTVSAHFLNFPAGSTVVVTNGIAFMLFSVIGRLQR